MQDLAVGRTWSLTKRRTPQSICNLDTLTTNQAAMVILDGAYDLMTIQIGDAPALARSLVGEMLVARFPLKIFPVRSPLLPLALPSCSHRCYEDKNTRCCLRTRRSRRHETLQISPVRLLDAELQQRAVESISGGFASTPRASYGLAYHSA